MPAVRRPRSTSPALPLAAAQQSGADKRERILSAAEDLLYRNGMVGTTMDMLCAELGVTKPYVYYYFKDKHEIVETLAWRASVACLTTMKFAADDRRLAALMEQGRHEGRLDFEDAAVTAKAMGGAVGFMYTWYRPDGRLPPEELVARLTGTLYRMIGLRPTAPKCAPKCAPKRTPTTRKRT